MANWIVFETTDSVIEILWDVALAFFVVRLAALYAALTLLPAWSLMFLLHHLHHNLPPSIVSIWKGNPHLLACVLTWLAALAAAWFLVRKFEVPRVWPFRLAMGASGAVVGMGMEAVVSGMGYEFLGWERMEDLVVVGGGWKMGMGAVVGMATMPVLAMGPERWLEKRAAVLRHRQREKMGEV
ncbi:hypothetical protein N657DRAFT_35778 [Parathielavia appendiculata]|uniref:Uncharacterized protein n=1 Tax=Parathielavia appendiculata TaxID=2587402 RepID=A0AAN6U906_9PEZI|nr:hypothetical protein N657DRAFT_35778 [Parathielavia appendiculata]